jgi:hypothetical protein
VETRKGNMFLESEIKLLHKVFLSGNPLLAPQIGARERRRVEKRILSFLPRSDELEWGANPLKIYDVII